MEERYESATILITAGPADPKLKWKPICQVTYESGREVVKELKLDLEYDTAEQTERAGLVFSKKWVEPGRCRRASDQHVGNNCCADSKRVF